MPTTNTSTGWLFRTATPADWPQLANLLTKANLPLEGAEENLGSFILAFQDGQLAGSAGLEKYGATALLRSVVVLDTERGKGLGLELVQRILDLARSLEIREVILLTTTAAAFYPRFGFERIERDDVPKAVKTSVEFTSACPASATVMRLKLAGQV